MWSAGLSHDGLRLAYQVATFSVCAMESVLDASRLCSPHSGFWLCQGNLLAVAGRITGLSGTSVCDIVPVFAAHAVIGLSVASCLMSVTASFGTCHRIRTIFRTPSLLREELLYLLYFQHLVRRVSFLGVWSDPSIREKAHNL